MTNTMTSTSAPTLRTARQDDIAAIERLLAAAELPGEGVAGIIAEHPDDFVVADDPESPGELVAVAGIEVCCDNALLRSVAVRPAWRKHGLGHELVRRLVCEAEARGIRALYLLTMTAEHYFPRFGFERTERASVPAEIAATSQFAGVCCSSATVMVRPLGGAEPALS